MHITGPAQELFVFETIYLGLLARMTKVATNVRAAVDAAAGSLRVRSEAELCTDFACGEAEVVTDEGRSHALADINPGDIVTLEHKDGHASEIRVVRRVFDEYSSPEW